MLVGLAALTIPVMVWVPDLTTILILAAAPSLIVQAVVLGCVHGREGRRWFETGGK